MLGFILHIVARYLILPIYSLVVLLRIRVARILASARGVFFLFFTNRYVFHAVLLIISVATIATQLQTKNATAETGRHSMLYTLVTAGQDEMVEESAAPNLLVKDAHYLGASTLSAMPSIDYDYDDADELPIADLRVPGSIAVQPEMESRPGDLTQPTAPVERTRTETYIVKAGDTVASIAAKFGVNVGTIIWTNKLSSRAAINPGDALKIPAVSGVLYTVKKGDTIASIARLYHADAEDIYKVNQITSTSILGLGQELILPNAVPIVVAPPKPKPTPIAVRPDVPKTKIIGKSYDEYQELTKPAGDSRAKPADVDTTNVSSGLIWPTAQHLINQYYGWQHTGVDINGDYTDPIYAAADGVVEKSGWNSGGYGLMILIDHDNGMKTRYGHASKLFVSAGDTVKKGQVIAMVGTTGRSTGTHLHFEVYNKNGARANPLAYVKR